MVNAANAAEMDGHFLVTIRHSSRWFRHSSLVSRLVTRRDEFVSRQFIVSRREQLVTSSLVRYDEVLRSVTTRVYKRISEAQQFHTDIPARTEVRTSAGKL